MEWRVYGMFLAAVEKVSNLNTFLITVN